MPTYEYLCSSCANAWEEVQKISEPALEVCPKCGKSTAKRQISAGNFILKGGGWYADLYSSAKPSAAKGDEKGDKSEKATTEAKSESTSESKPPVAKKESSPPPAAPAASTPSSTKE
jgi:putative FmdB family regulatory protein